MIFRVPPRIEKFTILTPFWPHFRAIWEPFFEDFSKMVKKCGLMFYLDESISFEIRYFPLGLGLPYHGTKQAEEESSKLREKQEQRKREYKSWTNKSSKSIKTACPDKRV